MTILSNDIRLLESERMTDTTDGGGRRTNRVIPDGVAGNVFPKVSRVDAVYGRVNLRKVYPHINTANLDVYAGAHFVITDAPDNNRISVLAFSTGSDFDTRTAARDRIESYVIAGTQSRMTLYGRQLQGTQAILAYQRVEEPLPEIGDVYAISTEVGGTTTAQQFVRVQDVAHEVRTFEEPQGGTFERRVLTIKIGAPLRFEFNGLAVPSRFSSDSAAATGRLRTTTVADAARYYGIQPLSAAVSSGALELTVTSVYAPIVPTTQRETPLNLATVAAAGALLPSGGTVSDPTIQGPAILPGEFVTFRTLRPIKPGTLRIALSGIGTWGSGDDGAGNVTRDPGSNGFAGTVDYEAGILRIAQNFSGAAQLVFSYTPAAYAVQAAHTHTIEVTLATRGTVYSVPLLPLPAPGTLMVDYRAMGKWYRLRDNGAGELVGSDAAYGTGTVDYVTGGATVTLGALPDVGSSVLLTWGSPAHFEVHTSDASAPYQEIQLEHYPVKPGSLSLVYESDGVEYTVTADAAGVLSGGGASGTVNHVTGLVRVEYAARLPDYDSSLAVSYLQLIIDPSQGGIPSGAALTETATIDAVGGTTVFTGVAAAPGTVTMLLNCVHTGIWGDASVAVKVAEDGAVTTTQHVFGGSGSYRKVIDADQAVGTFDHSTGVLTLDPGFASLAIWSYRWKLPDGNNGVWEQENYMGVLGLSSVGYHSVTYMREGLTTLDLTKTETLTLAAAAPLRLDITNTSARNVVPGSVLFSMAGKTFVDRNGALATDLTPSGSGLPAGTIDYSTGIATPTIWQRGAAPAVAVQACLTRFGDFTVTSMAFRTAGSPLRPASLYAQVTAQDGELLTATTDQNGVFSGTIEGHAEQTMGVVSVEFSKPVLPDTLRYSAVVLSNLPLNAEILGLDPVRLPSDGRVPIYRPADVAVVHHTDSYNAGTPAAGSTINVGRTDLSALWLEDANKKKLASSLYAVNLAAGTATMAADLSLTGYVPPIAAKHRIEEMCLLSDVQINGQLTLTAPLLRSFPSGSLLSSALLYGDLQARATNLFDQQTWTNVWQGTVIGSSATATYNDADYPVEVLNDGAVTERWRLNFTTTTSFQVIGENLGVIATGTTGDDIQPVNGLTGLPYFTLRAAGWGMGWVPGNQLRFDTIAAAPPTWLARCVLPGAALTGDSFDAQLRGDVD